MSDQEARRIISQLVADRGDLARQASRHSTVRFDINMNTGQTKSVGLASTSEDPWTLDKFRETLLLMVGDVVNRQLALDNPAESMFVDGTPFKRPEDFNKNITVLFGSGNNVRPVMKALMQEVSKRIPGTRWNWKASSPIPGRDIMLTRAAMGYGPVLLRFGEQLYYVPVSFYGDPDPTYGNVLFKGKKAAARGKKQGRTPRKTGRRGGKGWYGLTSAAVRSVGRTQGVYVRAVHSLKYVPRGRKLPPGKSVGDYVRYPDGTRGMYQGAWAFVLRLQLGRGRR